MPACKVPTHSLNTWQCKVAKECIRVGPGQVSSAGAGMFRRQARAAPCLVNCWTDLLQQEAAYKQKWEVWYR